MMWGRDYAEELQQLADQQFTPEHGIKVNVNLIQDENLLIMAKAAGIMPDIALGVPSEMTFEMALRVAAQDLTTLSGSDDLLENYAPGTLLPYYYQHGYYGIPETINFKVLFYRKDILDQLDLDVPDTWDDVYEMMPTLLQNQMNFYVDPKDSFDSDRKSTRLNSSHVAISYAVFCLKKKTTIDDRTENQMR